MWGKRDFSFQIDRKSQGVYYLLYFTIEPQFVFEIEKRLKIDTDIMRYLLVRQVKRKIKKTQPKAVRRYTPTAGAV